MRPMVITGACVCRFNMPRSDLNELRTRVFLVAGNVALDMHRVASEQMVGQQQGKDAIPHQFGAVATQDILDLFTRAQVFNLVELFRIGPER